VISNGLRAFTLLALALLAGPAWGAKKPEKLPEFPKEPADQQAARLWQAGTLAVSRGDYAWAIKQFEGCLKADPRHDSCKSGLVEAKQLVGWNPPKKKKKKRAFVPQPKDEGAETAGAAGEETKREAIKHWNAGILVYQKGEFEKAREEWAKCKELDPQNAECVTGLQRLDQEYGAKP
jgi:tetratricopeptide (TPR) repeat protein